MTRWCTASAMAQAGPVLAAIRERMAEVGLELHPGKTRIVYCKDGKRRGSYRAHVVHFLGFTFRPRGARTRTGQDVHRRSCPAVSKDALKKMSARGAVLAAAPSHRYPPNANSRGWINPVVRGWMQYYGAFYRSALYPLLGRINAYLMRWSRKKYKRLRGRKKAQDAWNTGRELRPRFFAHWAWTTSVPRVW